MLRNTSKSQFLNKIKLSFNLNKHVPRSKQPPQNLVTPSLLHQNNEMGTFNFPFYTNPFHISRFYGHFDCHYGTYGCQSHEQRPLKFSRRYATAAQAVVTTSSDDEVLIEDLQPDPAQPGPSGRVDQVDISEYDELRKRQIKIETEAWADVAEEYKKLLGEMCEQRLAPNLPYMKGLFLDWFEPLKAAIEAEQEGIRIGKIRMEYGGCFDQLPADMMAVITMHKLMGLLMMGSGDGFTTVVQAAGQIGEAIEQEVKIKRFLEKSKGNSANKDQVQDNAAKAQMRLAKKITNLMKKQNTYQVRKIVKGHDNSKPWGQDNQIKVGCKLIQLLTEKAYVQPPVDQLEHGPPGIRPAFIDTQKTMNDS